MRFRTKCLATLQENNYGGRVTDDKDRRCLNNILSGFYTPEILEDGYKFSSSGIYYAPPDGDKQSYLAYIKSLPLNATPVFGIHDNAEITSAIGSTNSLLSAVLQLQPRTTGGEGKSWSEQLMELAVDLEKRVPSVFDIDAVAVKYPIKFEESMNTLLIQELGRFNKLLAVVKKSLRDVPLALKGLVVMSTDLEASGDSMVNGLVPDMWSSVAYPSLKPLGSWINDLIARIDMLRVWIDHGKPTVYWISGFFFPQVSSQILARILHVGIRFRLI